MIQSISRTCLTIAMIAIAITVSQASFADSPETVTEQVSEQTGHASACSTDGCGPSSCADHCCSKCGIGHGVCYSDNKCDRCRRLGLLGRLRHFSRMPRSCRCETCRRGLRGGNGLGGNGLADRFNGSRLPNGGGGTGLPLLGTYNMVYPVNPDHFDNRDGQVYAAQGYGVPMAVPLAPVVRKQYNYSWGVPASRITHISNHAPQRMQPVPGYGYNGYGYNGYGYNGYQMGGHGMTPHGYCPQCEQQHGELTPVETEPTDAVE